MASSEGVSASVSRAFDVPSLRIRRTSSLVSAPVMPGISKACITRERLYLLRKLEGLSL